MENNKWRFKYWIQQQNKDMHMDKGYMPCWIQAENEII